MSEGAREKANRAEKPPDPNINGKLSPLISRVRRARRAPTTQPSFAIVIKFLTAFRLFDVRRPKKEKKKLELPEGGKGICRPYFTSRRFSHKTRTRVRRVAQRGLTDSSAVRFIFFRRSSSAIGGRGARGGGEGFTISHRDFPPFLPPTNPRLLRSATLENITGRTDGRTVVRAKSEKLVSPNRRNKLRRRRRGSQPERVQPARKSRAARELVTQSCAKRRGR